MYIVRKQIKASLLIALKPIIFNLNLKPTRGWFQSCRPSVKPTSRLRLGVKVRGSSQSLCSENWIDTRPELKLTHWRAAISLGPTLLVLGRCPEGAAKKELRTCLKHPLGQCVKLTHNWFISYPRLVTCSRLYRTCTWCIVPLLIEPLTSFLLSLT